MNNEENHNSHFASAISEALGSKNLSAAKLAQMTAIPERFVSALANGKTDNLPPGPYVRGYLMKVADTLDLNGEELWQSYQRENTRIRRSGPGDELPINRYAPMPVSKKMIAAGLLLSAFIGYVVWRSDDFLGKPNLYLASPLRDNLVVNENYLNLAGSIKPKDKLTVNGEVVYVKSDGSFTHSVYLKPGLNTVEIRVSRFLGRETVVTKQIFYSPAVN